MNENKKEYEFKIEKRQGITRIANFSNQCGLEIYKIPLKPRRSNILFEFVPMGAFIIIEGDIDIHTLMFRWKK